MELGIPKNYLKNARKMLRLVEEVLKLSVTSDSVLVIPILWGVRGVDFSAAYFCVSVLNASENRINSLVVTMHFIVWCDKVANELFIDAVRIVRLENENETGWTFYLIMMETSYLFQCWKLSIYCFYEIMTRQQVSFYPFTPESSIQNIQTILVMCFDQSVF